MLKKILITTLPVAAIIIAVSLCGNMQKSSLIFSINEIGGSYFIEGNIKSLTGVFLSSGKRIEIDPSTGELIPCEDDNGIDSIRLLWGDESNQSDTVFSTVSGSIIRLNTNFVTSSLKPECPPPALSEVEFTITGPDNQCFYELEVSESALKKGYKLSDILYSLEGDQGGFKPLKKWQNKESGPMNVWVKVKSTQQKINVSKSRNYKSCTIDICNETKKNKQLKELEKELAEFIKSYDDSASWQNLIQGKKLIFKKDGNDVPKEEFKTEVAVNGDNMLYAGDANGISIESIKVIDCKHFIINYSYDD